MKGRILIIDDDAGVRVTVEHFLKTAGYQTSCVSDGKQAFAQFEAFNPDVVITDMIMPNQDGIETIRNLKKQNPKLKIIAMSGGARIGNDNVLQKAKDMGADHIIAKPFEWEKLAELIRHCLDPL